MGRRDRLCLITKRLTPSRITVRELGLIWEAILRSGTFRSPAPAANGESGEAKGRCKAAALNSPHQRLMFCRVGRWLDNIRLSSPGCASETRSAMAMVLCTCDGTLARGPVCASLLLEHMYMCMLEPSIQVSQSGSKLTTYLLTDVVHNCTVAGNPRLFLNFYYVLFVSAV